MAKVVFSNDAIPYAAFIATVITEQKVNFVVHKQSSVETSVAEYRHNNTTIRGNFTAAKYIAAQDEKHQLNGCDEEQRLQIVQWTEFALRDIVAASDLNAIDLAAQRLNWLLESLTYLVGHRLTLADLIVYEALKAHKIFKGYQARYGKELHHINRWFNFIDSLPVIKECVSTLLQSIKKKVSTDDIIQMHHAVAEAALNTKSSQGLDISLPNAEVGKVCTRFPPEASGFLHIGHAKAALLNNYFARKYKGKLILRFDDTNPAKEKEEYEHAIIEDLATLNIKPDIKTFTSDSFDIILQYAEKMLKEGTAYVDDTEKEIFTEEKRNKIESKNRNNSVEKNLQMWEEMKKGSDYGRTCAVRAKFDMQADNATLRDPVLMRCKNEPHPRTGDKYKVYPTYDFACPIVDSIEGVTHALRTSEYNDRNDQFYRICDALGLRKPFIWDYSRLNFDYAVMSKRKLTKLVDNKYVDGWDDPRMSTLRGVMRRGLTLDALLQFILEVGASRSIANQDWDKLWTLNKKIIDPIAPRYTALPKNSLIPLTFSDVPAQLEPFEVPRHAKNASLGTKTIYKNNLIYLDAVDAGAIEDGEEITLMNWGNAIVTPVRDTQSGAVTSLTGRLNLKGSVKTTKKKLTWLAANDQVLTELQILKYDHIITKPKIDTDDFESLLRPVSKTEEFSVGDKNLNSLKQGDIIQLERRGFYRVDKAATDSSLLVLVEIPGGEQQKK